MFKKRRGALLLASALAGALIISSTAYAAQIENPPLQAVPKPTDNLTNAAPGQNGSIPGMVNKGGTQSSPATTSNPNVQGGTTDSTTGLPTGGQVAPNDRGGNVTKDGTEGGKKPTIQGGCTGTACGGNGCTHDCTQPPASPPSSPPPSPPSGGGGGGGGGSTPPTTTTTSSGGGGSTPTGSTPSSETPSSPPTAGSPAPPVAQPASPTSPPVQAPVKPARPKTPTKLPHTGGGGGQRSEALLANVISLIFISGIIVISGFAFRRMLTNHR